MALKLLYLSVLIALMELSSCKCDEDRTCQAFSFNETGIEIPAKGDSLHFVNSKRDRISFGITSVESTPARIAHTTPTGLGGCKVQYDCPLSGSYGGRDTVSRNGQSGFFLYVSATAASQTAGQVVTPQVTEAGAQMLDMGATLPYFYPNAKQADSIVYGLQLGPRTYDTVYIVSRDSSSSVTPNPVGVWRLYLHRRGGVVGFDDRVLGTTFYRE